MTDAEKKLWFSLRAHRLQGLGFRRQTPIGSYIADFACHERKLIVEVDGGQHSESKNDIERDRWLASKGYRVLRLWNSDVLGNHESILQTILDVASEATPLPDPPPQGGREHASTRGKNR